MIRRVEVLEYFTGVGIWFLKLSRFAPLLAIFVFAGLISAMEEFLGVKGFHVAGFVCSLLIALAVLFGISSWFAMSFVEFAREKRVSNPKWRVYRH